MGIMLLAGWSIDATYPGWFDHIQVNPLSLIVFISALGGIWTFTVRFMQAKGEIQRLDDEDPFLSPNLKTGPHMKWLASRFRFIDSLFWPS